MSRIYIAPHPEQARLAALFRAEMPDCTILTEQPDPDGPPVPFIVVGRPPAGVIAAVPGLRVVLSLNAGIEHLLASGEIAPDIPIVRMVDQGLSRGMAEWVLAQVLAWHRNLFDYARLQEGAQWRELPEKLARERTVCILGAGALGRPVAEHCVAFGFRTRLWSRSGQTVDGAAPFAGRARLLQAVRGADIVVNLLPLTAETRDIANAALFAAMARGGFFINGARGGHVVEADLIAALDSGQLSAAALDVFRTEPLPADNPLWHHPKIRVSPHVAAPTHFDIAVKEIARTVRRAMAGLPLENVVDRARGY